MLRPFGALLLVLGFATLPFAGAQIGNPIDQLDCAWSEVPIRIGPRWNRITFGYWHGVDAPVWLPGALAVPLLDRTVALSWTQAVNNCGLTDESDIVYTVIADPVAGALLNNGQSEIYWIAGAASFVRAVVMGAECDLLLGANFFPTPASNGGIPVILSVLTTEMGRCAGLAYDNDPYQTMGGGHCAVDPFTNQGMEPRACGLTLGRGDLSTAAILWPM